MLRRDYEWLKNDILLHGGESQQGMNPWLEAGGLRILLRVLNRMPRPRNPSTAIARLV